MENKNEQANQSKVQNAIKSNALAKKVPDKIESVNKTNILRSVALMKFFFFCGMASIIGAQKLSGMGESSGLFEGFRKVLNSLKGLFEFILFVDMFNYLTMFLGLESLIYICVVATGVKLTLGFFLLILVFKGLFIFEKPFLIIFFVGVVTVDVMFIIYLDKSFEEDEIEEENQV
ncbi:hypothetical protein A0H76_1877 [Hepatospora eriocheir]|uniref:Uncharacterized protein n=1 Tax=Hepatospora eriocheir TaxID=1081669 RepID=A0A1X0QKE3_9MICR|nr:hypothetical protein A0H76_1877 [Hepatospora eriocheir]